MTESYFHAIEQGAPELVYPHLHEAGGVLYDPERNMYLVGDYAAARQALSDPDGSSFRKDLAVVPWWLLRPHANPKAQEIMGSFNGYPGAIVGEVGERHLARRRVVSAAMNQAGTGLKNTSVIDELARTCVARLHAASTDPATAGAPIDLQKDCIDRVTLDLMALRLDLPQPMKELVAATAQAQADFTWPAVAPPYDEQPELAKDLIVMRDMCADLIDSHLEPATTAGRPDSVTRHLAMAVQNGRLDRTEAIANLFGLLNASFATTAGTVTRYVDHLIGSGEWDTIDPDSPSFLRQVEEGMNRWTGVHGWLRRTADDGAQLEDGRRLEHGGAYVLVLIEAANEDPARGDGVMLSFSPTGQHRCLGENEAVRTGVAIVRELKRAFPALRQHGTPERRANLALRTQSDLTVTVTAPAPGTADTRPLPATAVPQ